MKEIEDLIADVLSFVGELDSVRVSLLKLNVASAECLRLQANELERFATEIVVDLQSRVLRLVYLALSSTSTQDCCKENDMDIKMIGY